MQFQHVDTYVPHWGHAESTGRQLDICASVQSKCSRQMLAKFQHNVQFLHVILWSSYRIWSTCSTFWSSVDVQGCPDFGSFSMLNLPSWKRWAQREIVLQSTVSTPHTSISELWISVGVFPRNVSILMYALIVISRGTWDTNSRHFNALSFPSAHTPRDKLHRTSFLKFSSTTAEMAGKIASLLTKCCQRVHFFYDHPRTKPSYAVKRSYG